MSASKGEVLDTTEAKNWSYEELCAMEFRLFLQSECYQKQLDGTYTDISKSKTGLDFLYGSEQLGIDLKVAGIIRPKEDSSASILSGTIAYTSLLTEYAIEKTATSELVQAQINSKEIDVLTGKKFKEANAVELTPSQKKEEVLAKMAEMSNSEKLEMFKQLISTPDEEMIEAQFEAYITAYGGLRPMALMMMQAQGMSAEEAQAFLDAMDDETLYYNFYQKFRESAIQAQIDQINQMFATKTPEELLFMMEQTLATLTDDDFAKIYDETVYSNSTYEKNLTLLGNVDLDSPSAINLYCDTFEDKDTVAALITKYNERDGVKGTDKEIKYTDYVALLMSSVTTIVDAITYVLIAFVAISLVVSSIMIGIITYISVLERTKEIGILRAIGASKKDIRRVFNAETLIVGFVAGALGIGITLGLNVIINIILFELTGLANLKAVLPPTAALVLVGISMALTLIAGIFPSGFAAKRNPVEALRTE